MVEVKDLTDDTLEDLWKEVKEDTLGVGRWLLEESMEVENLEQLRAADPDVASGLRRGYRNGHRNRSLLTETGMLEDLRVPRDRDGHYQPTVLPRCERRQEKVNETVREMFLTWVSPRKVQEVVDITQRATHAHLKGQDIHVGSDSPEGRPVQTRGAGERLH